MTTWTPFLGQIPLVTGPASTPAYAYPPAGYFAGPSGAPLMSEELTSPQSEHIAREFHCYKSPSGAYVSVPFGQADAYKAAGYEAVDYSNCGSPPLHAEPVGGASFLMGQAASPYSSGIKVVSAAVGVLSALAAAGLFILARGTPRKKPFVYVGRMNLAAAAVGLSAAGFATAYFSK